MDTDMEESKQRIPRGVLESLADSILIRYDNSGEIEEIIRVFKAGKVDKSITIYSKPPVQDYTPEVPEDTREKANYTREHIANYYQLLIIERRHPTNKDFGSMVFNSGYNKKQKLFLTKNNILDENGRLRDGAYTRIGNWVILIDPAKTNIGNYMWFFYDEATRRAENNKNVRGVWVLIPSIEVVGYYSPDFANLRTFYYGDETIKYFLEGITRNTEYHNSFPGSQKNSHRLWKLFEKMAQEISDEHPPIPPYVGQGRGNPYRRNLQGFTLEITYKGKNYTAYVFIDKSSDEQS